MEEQIRLAIGADDITGSLVVIVKLDRAPETLGFSSERYRNVWRRSGRDDGQAVPERNIVVITNRHTGVACDGPDLGSAPGRIVIDRDGARGGRGVNAHVVQKAGAGFECSRRVGGDVCERVYKCGLCMSRQRQRDPAQHDQASEDDRGEPAK
jgi:hypothetical protein